jgi:iron complex outermembrane receptor protein
MKKLTLVQAACLLACGVTLSTAQAQSGVQDTPEIIITASRSEQDLQTAPVGATIITRAQIESAGVVDANEAIRKIGGVSAKSDLNGGREYKLDLRGFGETSNANTVVLIDGIRISENEQAAARLSSIAASAVERIEIVRGGSSVMWGEGATSGVINIVLRTDAKAGVSGAVAVGVQSFGGQDASASIRVGVGKTAFDLQAMSNSSNGSRPNSQSHQDVVSAGVSGSDGALKFRARIQNEVAGARLPGPLTFTEFAANPRQTETKKMKDWAGGNETRISSGIDYSFGAWTAVIDAARKIRAVDSFSSDPTLGDYASKTKTTNNQLSPRLIYKAALNQVALTANMGVDITQWTYGNANTYGGRAGTQNNHALFAMTDWLFPSQTRVVAGLRSETIAKSALDVGSTIPAILNNKVQASELSINQTIVRGWDVYGRLAKSYRLANIDEYTYTNPLIALRPQTSNDTELGVKFRQGGSSLAARYFVQQTTDEIAFDPTANGPFGPFGANINLDPTKRSGVELQGAAQLSTQVTLSGTLQSINAVFVGGINAGKHIPLVSEQTATIRAAYKLDAHQSVETAWRMLGSSYFNDDANNSCGKKIPSSQSLDALYRWKDKGFEVSVGAINVLNKQSYNYAYSCTSGNLYPDAGRTLRATLKYNF